MTTDKTRYIKGCFLLLAVLLTGAIFFSCGRVPTDPYSGIVQRIVGQTTPDGLLTETGLALDSLAAASPEALRPTVQAICRALVDAGRHPEAVSVASLVFGVDEAENTEIAARLLTSILLPGNPAPPISGLAPAQNEPKFTVLLFHESACRTCGDIIWNIKQRYGELQNADVRVVTVSTDTDEKVWMEYAEGLPWPDKLCDHRGFYSPAMIAYGVAATPTLYLIDGTGKIVDQYAEFDQIWERINTEQQ